MIYQDGIIIITNMKIQEVQNKTKDFHIWILYRNDIMDVWDGYIYDS